MSADGKGEDPKHAAEHGQISPQDREAIRQRSSELGKKLDKPFFAGMVEAMGSGPAVWNSALAYDYASYSWFCRGSSKFDPVSQEGPGGERSPATGGSVGQR